MQEQKTFRQRGQVTPLGDDKYKIAVPVGKEPSGKRQYHYETLRGVKEPQAWKRVNSILAQVDNGTYFQPDRSPLKELMSEWLDRKRRKGLKHTTLDTYQCFVEAFINPALGDMPLAHLNLPRLQQFYDALQDKGYKPSTIRLIHAVLKQALEHAVRYGKIQVNHAREVELPPRNKPRKARVFDEEEVFQFIEAARQNPNDLVFVFALFTGLRPCELIGLEYDRIELVKDDSDERGLAHIIKTVVKLKGGGWEFSDPKTENGLRSIYFPAFLYHELEARKAKQLERLRILGQSHRLIFTNSKGNPLDRDNLGARQFKNLLTRAKLSCEGRTLYTLRRSSATFSLLLGDSLKGISEKLGHAKVEFTQNEYMDVLPTMQRITSDRLENYLLRRQLADTEAEGVM